MRKDHNTSLLLLITGKLKFDHKQGHDRRLSDLPFLLSVWESCKKLIEEDKDGFCCCKMSLFCSFTSTGSGKKICLVDCREHWYVLQALQMNSTEKLQRTGLSLLSRILFALSWTAKPIVWGVTQHPAILPRRGWRVYRRKDPGCFLLSSALLVHPCIMQVTTRFLSSKILGNLQNFPWRDACLLLLLCLSAWTLHATSSSPQSHGVNPFTSSLA